MTGPPGSSRPRALRFVLACNLSEVRTAAQAVRRFLSEQGCVEEELMDYELALVEGCNNAVKHVGASGRKKPVIVEVLFEDEQVEMRVTDHTYGFEWPKKVALPDGESESGRGLYLIKSLMDYTNYLRSPEENMLVMRKRRDGSN
jgi:anti-sigma regulatory factor (Ser/Thr protein kinase)